jgi:hypothetical protein
MDQETQKIIAEQMKKLPKDVIAAIISVDYKTKLVEITHRQKLLIDQAGKLEMETTLVMMGLEPLADFIGNIEREMGLNTIRAKEVALDVSENIFKPIRNSLQKMNADLEKEEEAGPNDVVEGGEPEVTKFTNSNEAELNRDQILSEIENPVLNNPTTPLRESSVGQTVSNNSLEIRPKQEINIYENKMTAVTVTPQQIVTAKPENKLPEVALKTYKADPYREPLS